MFLSLPMCHPKVVLTSNISLHYRALPASLLVRPAPRIELFEDLSVCANSGVLGNPTSCRGEANPTGRAVRIVGKMITRHGDVRGQGIKRAIQVPCRFCERCAGLEKGKVGERGSGLVPIVCRNQVGHYHGATCIAARPDPNGVGFVKEVMGGSVELICGREEPNQHANHSKAVLESRSSSDATSSPQLRYSFLVRDPHSRPAARLAVTSKYQRELALYRTDVAKNKTSLEFATAAVTAAAGGGEVSWDVEIAMRLPREGKSTVRDTAARCERATGSLKPNDLVHSPRPACYGRRSTLGLGRDAELLYVEAVLAAATSAPAGRKKRCEEVRWTSCRDGAFVYKLTSTGHPVAGLKTPSPHSSSLVVTLTRFATALVRRLYAARLSYTPPMASDGHLPTKVPVPVLVFAVGGQET
ncbi:hypothetical protein BJY52DRAFT_1364568 [Lactarius psammicola]|nr:hypothetical protein BJY52DRAFT_1364568 [Lactarius psammicola]